MIAEEDDLIILVPLAGLRRLADPIRTPPWVGMSVERPPPLSLDEVLKAPLNNGRHPDGLLFSPWRRVDHAGRIHYLMETDWDDPIEIDVGVPRLGCVPSWIVTDGNHRLAAAILRGDNNIAAWLSGDVDYCRDLGLMGIDALRRTIPEDEEDHHV